MRVFAAFMLVLLVAPSATMAQEDVEERDTKTGFVEPGAENMQMYEFIALGGPVTGTLVWDDPDANLSIILVCDEADPVTYAVSAGLVDRVSRFEVGVLPFEICLVSVLSVDNAASYWLNVRDSSDSLISRVPPDDVPTLRPFLGRRPRLQETLTDVAGKITRSARVAR